MVRGLSSLSFIASSGTMWLKKRLAVFTSKTDLYQEKGYIYICHFPSAEWRKLVSSKTTISGWISSETHWILKVIDHFHRGSHFPLPSWWLNHPSEQKYVHQISNWIIFPIFMGNKIPTAEWNHPSFARKTQIQGPSTRERSSNFTDPQMAETFRRPCKPSAAAVARVGLSLCFFLGGELFEAHDRMFFHKKD